MVHWSHTRLTKDSGSERDWILRGKDSKEPWCGIEERCDLILLQELVDCWNEVMHQSRELIESCLQIREAALIDVLVSMEIH